MYVNKLLDKAKRVIAAENKKEQRQSVKDAIKIEQKFQKTKSTLQSAGMSIMGSANNTASSMISVKDRAMAAFENCRSAKDPSNVNNFKSLSLEDIDPEQLAKWE